MKQKYMLKRIGVLCIATALLAVFSLTPAEVHASALPDSSMYVTGEELSSFNTEGMNTSAKIVFGAEGQQWWIAGSEDENSLVLMAASPFGEKQPFSQNNEIKEYDKNWGCDYKGNSEPADVYANHYGGSDIRKILKEYEATLFTAAEKELMQDTTITAEDTKTNDGHLYDFSVTDKLYLPAYSNYDELLFVGDSTEKDSEGEFVVDNSYVNSPLFWTRTPVYSDFFYMGSNVDFMCGTRYYLTYNADVLPAFKFDSSSVLFASAVPAACSDMFVPLSTDDEIGAFTLRYEGNVAEAKISASGRSVQIGEFFDADKEVYLVVQNSKGAWTKKVAENDLIFADELDDSLTSLENCRVWLETTDQAERKTYAQQASRGSAVNVRIVPGVGLSISSQNSSQPDVDDTIETIEVTVQKGYELPDDYISRLEGLKDLNGLKVVKTDAGFEIYGKPNGDVYLALPDLVLPDQVMPDQGILDTSEISKSDSPDTGESGGYLPWLIGLILLGCGIMLLIVDKHRKRRHRV